MLSQETVVGIIGAGAMGTGIAQVAATAGHRVILYDSITEQLARAEESNQAAINRLVQKGKLTQEYAGETVKRIEYARHLGDFKICGLVIEAVMEKLDVKQSVFDLLESMVKQTAVLASNTSSLSITSIASACRLSNRVLGMHFFNPAPVMPLVELVSGVATDPDLLLQGKALLENWGKTVVLAKDTPGFIVNRVARPYYGEALRIYEEGIADFVTIDWAMTDVAGFRMGPFELMDFIGNDINFAVTETIFREFWFDPRYRPSFTQKRLVEARRLGRKSGRGYYEYAPGAVQPEPNKDLALGKSISDRVIAMLINEAADSMLLNIASRDHIDLAMTKGVNYPKGLLKWADEWGIPNVLAKMEELFQEYGEDRYRPTPMLRRMVKQGTKFYEND
jgi:3-hydroxybutyryl-CoA dehydrogenase